MGGMPINATWDQDSFRVYQGLYSPQETWENITANPAAAVNTNPTKIDPRAWFVIGFLVQETAGSNQAENPTFFIEYRLDTGGGFGSWTALPSSSTAPVRAALAIEASALTASILGAGTFRDGDTNNDTTPPLMLATNGSDEYELLQGFEFPYGTATTPLAEGDVIEFRLLVNDGNLNTTAGGDPFTTNGGTYTNTPSITVASQMSIAQSDYRLRNDDGTEATATWKAAANTTASIDVDTNFRTRFLLKGTGNGSTLHHPTVEYRHKPDGGSWGSWSDVLPSSNTTAPIKAASSPNYAAGTATQQLGAGTFTDGFIWETNGAPSFIATNILGPWVGGDEMEMELCLTLNSTATTPAAAGDQVELRVKDYLFRWNEAPVLDSWTNTALVTVAAAGATTNITISSSTTNVASLAKEKTGVRSLTTTATGTSTLTRLADLLKSISVTATGAATVGRVATWLKSMSTTATGVATLTKGLLFTIAMVPVLLATATLTRVKSGVRAITVAPVGTATLTRLADLKRSFTPVLATIATVGREATWLKVMTTTGTGTATLVKTFCKVLVMSASAAGTATLTRVAEMVRTISASGSVTASLSLIKTFARSIVVTATGSTTFVRVAEFLKTIGSLATATATLVANKLTGVIPITISAAATGAATLTKVLTKVYTISTTATGTATLTRVAEFFKSMSTTVTGTASLVRLIGRTISTTVTPAIVILKLVGRTISVGASGLATLTATKLNLIAMSVTAVGTALLAAVKIPFVPGATIGKVLRGLGGLLGRGGRR